MPITLGACPSSQWHPQHQCTCILPGPAHQTCWRQAWQHVSFQQQCRLASQLTHIQIKPIAMHNLRCTDARSSTPLAPVTAACLSATVQCLYSMYRCSHVHCWQLAFLRHQPGIHHLTLYQSCTTEHDIATTPFKHPPPPLPPGSHILSGVVPQPQRVAGTQACLVPSAWCANQRGAVGTRAPLWCQQHSQAA